jgi:hypothetical protein
MAGDPKATVLNPDGSVRWVFRPPRRFSKRMPHSWNGFKQMIKEVARGEVNVLAPPPLLTTDGMLYVAFGSPYDSIYALNVGVGLAANSPWPMRAGGPEKKLRKRALSRGQGIS